MKEKIQCLIYGKWYVQVCSHTVQAHKINNRQYKEMFGLDRKKGIVPAWYKEKKAYQGLISGGYENLKKGIKYRFKKGQNGVGVYKRSKQTLERLKTQNYERTKSKRSNERSL